MPGKMHLAQHPGLQLVLRHSSCVVVEVGRLGFSGSILLEVDVGHYTAPVLGEQLVVLDRTHTLERHKR